MVADVSQAIPLQHGRQRLTQVVESEESGFLRSFPYRASKVLLVLKSGLLGNLPSEVSGTSARCAH